MSPAPLSLLIKAAPILTEEMYGDIQPAAWELLLSVDEHMAGAAGETFSIRIHLSKTSCRIKSFYLLTLQILCIHPSLSQCN